jgi:hypothetical protein
MEKWVAAGKPVIPRVEWDSEMVLKKAGEITVKEAME